VIETTRDAVRRLLRGPGDGHGTLLVRGAAVAFALQVAGAGLSYLLQIGFARWLGATGFGSYTFTVGWATIVAVLAGLGLATAVLRYIPSYLAADDRAGLRGILRTSVAATLLAGVAVALLGTAFVVVVSPTSSTEILIGFWMVPLLALGTLGQEAARGFHRVGLAYGPPFVLRPLLAFALGGLCLAVTGKLGVTSALGAMLGATAVGCALQGIGLWRLTRKAAGDTAPRRETRSWLRTAFPLLLIAGFVVVLMQTDVVVVGAIEGSRAAGLYGAAAKTATLVGFVLVAVSALAAPLFSRLFTLGDREGLQRLVTLSAHWIFWPSLGVSLFLAAAARPLLGLFGAGFAAAAPILLILLVGQLVNAAAGPVGWLLLMSGDQDEAAKVYGATAAVHLALLGIAVPLLGSDGAALATSASYGVWNLWLHRLVVARLGLHPSVFHGLGGTRPGEGEIARG
jgi:O-antigen/teichoic acid export membrane protein